MLKINRIQNKRMIYPEKSESYFLKLEDYILFAKKSISRFAPVLSKKLLRDDDFVADVAHDIMIADWKWNGLGNRIGYRSKCAKWSILGKIKIRKRDIKTISFSKVMHASGPNGGRKIYLSDIIEDKKNPNNAVTEEHLKNFSLTSIQKEFLVRSINGEEIKDIAEDKDVTPQYVHLTLKIAKEKLRKYYDKKVAL